MLAVSRSNSFKLWCSIGLISVCAGVHAEAPITPSASSPTPPAVNAIKKWETDTAMRQSMDNIRQAMAASQERIAQEQLSAQDYQRLADTLDKNLATLLKTRHTSKEAEKAFHLIVMMDLTQSLELMRSASKVQLQRAGAFGVQQSLRNYAQHFQHPGWISGT